MRKNKKIDLPLCYGVERHIYKIEGYSDSIEKRKKLSCFVKRKQNHSWSCMLKDHILQSAYSVDCTKTGRERYNAHIISHFLFDHL